MAATIPNLHKLLLIVFIWKAAANKNPQIDINPSQIHIGLSEVLDVNCSFTSYEAQDMATLISLVLSRAKKSDENFTEIAAVTLFSPDKVKLLATENVKTEGLHGKSKESYLNLQWAYPDVGQSGLYQCSAYMVDEIGHCIVRHVTGQVSVKAVDLDRVMDAIREMKQDMEQTDNHVEILKQQVSLLEQSAVEQDNYCKYLERNISDMSNHIKMMEQNMSQMNNYTNSLEDLRNQLILLSGKFVTPPLMYNNKKYYLSKDMYRDVNLAQTTCQTFNGILTEINDSDEYNAIVNFLNSLTGYRHVLIGGSDEVSEGKWILPSTGQSLPFTQWYSNQPNSGISWNCLLLTRSFQWKMEVIQCVRDLSNSCFLCELPQ